jgi:hypothetical protein
MAERCVRPAAQPRPVRLSNWRGKEPPDSHGVVVMVEYRRGSTMEGGYLMVWRMKGQWVKNCSCDAGCPCDFNRVPTHHVCEGMVGMNIIEGNFEDVSLSGLKWAVTYNWPGPLHERNGTVQPFIDVNANDVQRQVLLQILSGQAGGTLFEILSAIVSKVEEPQFVPIAFEFDLRSRRARVAVEGAFETVTEPIRNPVSGEEHRIQVSIPEGFEYKLAEISNAVVNRGTGTLAYDWPSSHSSLAELEHTHAGVIQAT